MSDEMVPSALRLSAITRTFRQADASLEVLRGVDLEVRPGEMVALVGPSGAGKSTLLQIAGLLEKPTSGQVAIAGQETARMGDRERTQLRSTTIGFVYQFHHLLPEFTALENVMLPQIIADRPKRVARERAKELLDQVGLAARTSHRPARLSGGEQQRVAIARALANAPALLLADEPTGNLDQGTSDGVFAMLQDLVANSATGALVATHNLDLAHRMTRIVEIRDGRVAAVPPAAA
ncbi:MAG: ABC transporter ATP-binding protein [Rhodospirillaceae bacterium]|nr:ABC transporter ATP-binding protein [Rhodospirillaceae bacterium]